MNAHGCCSSDSTTLHIALTSLVHESIGSLVSDIRNMRFTTHNVASTDQKRQRNAIILLTSQIFKTKMVGAFDTRGKTLGKTLGQHSVSIP